MSLYRHVCMFLDYWRRHWGNSLICKHRERGKSLSCLGKVHCAWNGGVFFTWTNATRPISIASQKNPCLIPQTRLTSPFLARCLSFRAHLMATSFACFCYMSCPSSRLWCLSCSLLYLHMPRLLDSAQICGE